MQDGSIHSELIQPLDMLSDNPFITISEENLPEVQIVHSEDTIGTGGNDNQIRRNKGKGKGRGKGKNKKQQQPKYVEIREHLVGSGSAGTQNENDTFDYNSYGQFWFD
jgi:hypothetical protein